MTNTFRNLLLVSVLFLAATINFACSTSSMDCGTGTVEQDGNCVPVISECAAGTVLQAGECVSACSSGEYWDGNVCAAVPSCASGTTFNTVTGQCEPNEDACAAGTHFESGVCVPDNVCGEGTHPEGDVCVPDGLPDPDVTEDPDPNVNIEFDLPDPGGQVSLGGVIEAPTDITGDGNENTDFDGFVFSAAAGTHLRFSATSEGAALPAFIIYSIDDLETGHPQYTRYGLEPNDLDCVREVYLPYTDKYIIWVSDYSNVLSYIFDYGSVPVGGDDFSYFMIVENLGTPSPTDISSLPAADSGDLSDGALRFYGLNGLSGGDAVSLQSAGLPVVDVVSDVYAILMVFDGAGDLVEEKISYRPDESADSLLAFEAGQDYLIVLDFFLIVGPNREYAFDAKGLDPTICSSVDCSAEDIPAGETGLLAWDLVPGEFFVVGIYLPMESNEVMRMTIMDEQGNKLAEDQYVDWMYNGVGRAYAGVNRRVYVWLREVYGNIVPEFSADDRIITTPALASGQDYTGLGVNDMPPYTYYPAGVDHFVGTAGQVAYFSGFTTHDGTGAWSQYAVQMLMNSDFERVGPIIDTLAWNFPDSFISPVIGYIPEDGHYIHYVQDPNGDILDGTYDVSVNAYTPAFMGSPTVGNPTEVLEQTFGGQPALYTFNGGENQYVEITVDPGGLNLIQPELWIFNLGEAVWYWIYDLWIPSPDAIQLGVVLLETAENRGETLTVGYLSPYDGMSLLLMQDAGGGATIFDNFDITIDVPPPPANDACADAETIVLAAGQATVEAGNASATDTVSEHVCEGYLYDTGPDVFYSISLAAGDTIDITMDADFNGSLYLFDDCSDVVDSIVAESNEGNPEVISYEVPAGAGGTYLIGADACGGGGNFTLDITVTGS